MSQVIQVNFQENDKYEYNLPLIILPTESYLSYSVSEHKMVELHQKYLL